MVTTTLATDELEVAFGSRIALTGVSVELHPASTLAVIGPNGSGKSTFLRALAGLVEPTAGAVRGGARSVALVLQSTEVDRGTPLTVADTVAMARYPSLGLLRRFRRADREAVVSAMRRLEIEDLAGRQLQELSGGQRQRVLIAQGLAQEADVLLLDEPVTGLDLASRRTILEVIDAERAAGRAVVMTTHNLEDARVCDRVLLLATCMVAIGTPTEVICEEHLRTAYGGRVMRLGSELVVDDPHHDHGHTH